MIKSTLVAAVTAASALAFASGAEAGLDGLHKQAKEGNLVCMTDHYHRGQSGEWASKELAEKAALRSWVTYTAAEYGRHWGSWKLAADKDMSCKSGKSHRGTVYMCTTKARPCRPAGSGHHHRRHR